MLTNEQIQEMLKDGKIEELLKSEVTYQQIVDLAATETHFQKLKDWINSHPDKKIQADLRKIVTDRLYREINPGDEYGSIPNFNIKNIKGLLSLDIADINSTNERINATLKASIIQGNEDLAKILLDIKGAKININDPDKSGLTLIMYAAVSLHAKGKRQELLTILKEHGAKITKDQLERMRNSPVVDKETFGFLQDLYRSNDPDKELEQAIQKKDLALVKDALQKGARMERVLDSMKISELMEVKEFITQIPEQKGSQYLKDRVTKELQPAIIKSDIAAVKNLMALSQPNINAEVGGGTTLLVMAAQAGSRTILQELLAVEGVDVNKRDAQIITPIMRASLEVGPYKPKQKEIVDILKSKGATVSAEDMKFMKRNFWRGFEALNEAYGYNLNIEMSDKQIEDRVNAVNLRADRAQIPQPESGQKSAISIICGVLDKDVKEKINEKILEYKRRGINLDFKNIDKLAQKLRGQIQLLLNFDDNGATAKILGNIIVNKEQIVDKIAQAILASDQAITGHESQAQEAELVKRLVTQVRDTFMILPDSLVRKPMEPGMSGRDRLGHEAKKPGEMERGRGKY